MDAATVLVAVMDDMLVTVLLATDEVAANEGEGDENALATDNKVDVRDIEGIVEDEVVAVR